MKKKKRKSRGGGNELAAWAQTLHEGVANEKKGTARGWQR